MSVFTKVRLGVLPGEVIYEDADVFVMLTIQPHTPGHCLVIPVKEQSDILDCDTDLSWALLRVAQHIMRIQKGLYDSPRVALVSAGLEVAHTHLHVFPLYKNSDLDPARAQAVDTDVLKSEADRLRAALKTDPVR